MALGLGLGLPYSRFIGGVTSPFLTVDGIEITIQSAGNAIAPKLSLSDSIVITINE